MVILLYLGPVITDKSFASGEFVEEGENLLAAADSGLLVIRALHRCGLIPCIGGGLVQIRYWPRAEQLEERYPCAARGTEAETGPYPKTLAA